MPPRFVALVGPTASGKTGLAVRAVEESGVPVEVVVLDSRQLYRGLDLGTGKPDAEQRERVPHHLLDCLELHEVPDAMDYRRRVEEVSTQIHGRGAVVLLVGGAGFYLRALREGFHEVEYSAGQLAAIRDRLATLDDEALVAALRAVDPVAAARLHPNDRYRVGRALELCELSGRPASELEAEFRPRPIHGARIEVALLMPSREVLHRRIEERTQEWLKSGWEEEVSGLLEAGTSPAAAGLQILGYRQVLGHLKGELDADRCRHEIIVATRRYAKAQRTWFRKEDPRLSFDRPDSPAVSGLARLLAETAASP